MINTEKSWILEEIWIDCTDLNWIGVYNPGTSCFYPLEIG